MAVTAPPSLEPMRSERGHASPDPILPALFRRSRRPLVQVSSSGSLRLVIPAVVPLFSFTSNLFLGGGVRKILLLCCDLASRLPFIYLFCCPPPGTCFVMQREGREGGEGGRAVSVGNIRRLPLRAPRPGQCTARAWAVTGSRPAAFPARGVVCQPSEPPQPGLS